MGHLQEYIFEVDWYSDFEDEEKHSYGLVMGSTQTDVANKIFERIPNIDKITIKLIDENDFVWLNKKNYDLLSDTMSDFMLDQEDEGDNEKDK